MKQSKSRKKGIIEAKKKNRTKHQLAEESSKRITKHTGYYLDGADNSPKEFANSIHLIKNKELRG